MTSVGDRDLTSELRAWVERITLSQIREAQRLPRGRPAWILDLEGPTKRAVLKMQRAPQQVMKHYRFLSEFNLQRENAALVSLRDTDVPVPKVLGFREDPDAILLEFVPGVADLSCVPVGPERDAAVREYAEALATLHRLDLRRLDSFANVLSPPQGSPTSFGPLGAAVEDYRRDRSRLERPDPLVDLAIAWLDENAPVGRDTSSFVQGDAGVNQYLVADGHLSSVLDWELSHFGDPMADLGNARFREVLYPSATFDVFLTHYAQHAQRPPDRSAIRYYTVVAATIMLAAIQVNVQRPRVKNPESLAQLWWNEISRVALCDALLDAIGADPAASPEPWHPTTASSETVLSQFMKERTSMHVMMATDEEQRAQLHGTYLLSQALALEAEYGPTLARETAADVARVIARPTGRGHDDLTTLSDDLARGVPDNLEDVLVFFARLARRRLRLVEPLSAQDRSESDDDTNATNLAERRHPEPSMPQLRVR